MKIGSSTVLSTPPILSPNDAFAESPMLLSIDETVLLNINGTPPITTTKNRYCLENSSTFSLAPRKTSIFVIPIKLSNEKRHPTPSAIHIQAADTFDASSSFPAPIRRAISVPPPTPKIFDITIVSI